MNNGKLYYGFCVLFMLIICCTETAKAAYLRNVPQTFTQPDGRIIHCFATGDEYYNWLHDEDGYTIVRNKTTGFFEFAILKENKLLPSGYIVGSDDPEKMGLSRGVNIKIEKYRELFPGPLLSKKEFLTAAPRTGTLNNIVVFIRFQGDNEFSDNTSYFEDMFNSTTAGDNSVRNYFTEVSYSQFTVNSTFYPQTTGTTVVSYLDSHARGYFMPDSLDPIGYADDTQKKSREHTLLKNAVDAIASQVPATLNIDGDGDGNVDNVCFIVRGSPSVWNSLLWPHRWSLYSNTVYIRGKRVFDYNLQLQTTLYSDGVGVLGHEMFHTLGAPDLYHYSHDGLRPVGSWDIMESSFNPPQHMGAYMKFRYGAWISAIPEITAPGTYWLNPLTSSTNNCYKIASPNSSSEYFVLEYRRRQGTFEGLLPGDGLLVYRINTAQDGEGNENGPPDEVYIYRPNGTTTTNGIVNAAFFNDDVGRIGINDDTNPSCCLSDGNDGGLCITSIGHAGNIISFVVGGGIARFIASPTSGQPPLAVQFTDQSTGCINSWSWNFGDGQGSNVQYPVHTYSYAGYFSVSLTVTGPGGSNQLTRSEYIFVNTPPIATNLTITPQMPKTADELRGEYTFYDADGDPEDLTQIRWYKNNVQQSVFDNQMTVPHTATSKGERWYFTVKPHDGKEYGQLSTSPTIEILNTPPVLSQLAISPAKPLDTEDLSISYHYHDDDGDPENRVAREIRWYKNGLLQSSYDDMEILPSSATIACQQWYATVRPHDGDEYGLIYASLFVNIDMIVIAESEAMQDRHPWYGNPCDDGWRLTHENHAIYADISFPADFMFRFTVIAKGEIASHAAPWLLVEIGDEFRGTCEINCSEWQEFSFVGFIKAGIQRIRLSYLNDCWNHDTDRNLLLNKIKISCQFDTPAENLFVFEAEDMQHQSKANYQDGDDVTLCKKYAFLGQDMYFEKSAIMFEIYTRADFIDNQWPQMSLRIDDRIIATMTVDQANTIPYVMDVNQITPGKHRVEIAFQPESYAYLRNIYVDKLVLHVSDGGLLKNRDGLADDTENNIELPNSFFMEQNYPNPFNQSTNINYQLPEGLHVTVLILNALGHEIISLVDEYKTSGYHSVTWDGCDRLDNEMASGVYILRMQAGHLNFTKKMLLLR